MTRSKVCPTRKLKGHGFAFQSIRCAPCYGPRGGPRRALKKRGLRDNAELTKKRCRREAEQNNWESSAREEK
jgi:hypothetical protein